MSYVVFLLSLLLLTAGVAGAYFSLDLLPTSMGMLYALSGAGAAIMAVVVLTVGILIRRIDRLAKTIRDREPIPIMAHPPRVPASAPFEPAVVTPEPAPEPETMSEPFPEGDEPATPGAAEPALTEAPEEDEEPINENRVGHLPTLAAIEHAIETPEHPPALIGRYSSGGANYMIFADGSIEAETEEGAYKFGSMGDFKRYLAERRGAKNGE